MYFIHLFYMYCPHTNVSLPPRGVSIDGLLSFHAAGSGKGEETFAGSWPLREKQFLLALRDTADHRGWGIAL